MIESLPAHFVQTISGAFGDGGRFWLESLPHILKNISEEWHISIGDHYPNLSYHYVAPCVSANGDEVVIKLAFHGDPNPTIFNEVRMLELNGGDGMLKLLRFDPEKRAMLLEKLTPGKDLRAIFEGNEIAVVEIAADLMWRIWREPPAGYSFPRVEDWFNNMFRKAAKTNFPSGLLVKTSRLFEELNSNAGRPMLLHGDLHHWNILSASREPYLVIDPKGIIGNYRYEMSTFLINHSNWLRGKDGYKEKLDAAIRAFSVAFDIDETLIRKWTFAQSVLSAWWTFEEGSENWRGELARTEIWEV